MHTVASTREKPLVRQNSEKKVVADVGMNDWISFHEKWIQAFGIKEAEEAQTPVQDLWRK